MDDEKKFLTEWITHFLKSRNMIFKTIEHIGEHEEYDLYVKHKTKEQYVIAQPRLNQGILQKISQDNHIMVVCFNTKENFEFIVENWKQLVTFPNLTIYLINPLSDPDKKWIISPHVHQKICDNTSLKTGLSAMFETVQPLTQEKIKSLIKQKV